MNRNRNQKSDSKPAGIRIELPDEAPLVLTHLVLDFTGTLSLDGTLLPGVAGALRRLSRYLTITVLTADTFGTAAASLGRVPVDVRLVKTGKDKKKFVRGLGGQSTVAIGNGRNDVDMLKTAALGIAVAGREGCAAELVCAADILVCDIRDALGLLSHPLRIKATLRR